MLKKQYVKSRNVCKVTFELPESELPTDIPAEEVSIVGEFNDWATDATPMKRIKSTGSYKAIIDLEPDSSFQFRYLINDDVWLNDESASSYVVNEFGSQNSVIETSIN